MAQNFGVSFVPDDQNLQQGKAGASRGGMTPTQQAVKLLSLRLPRVVGGSPIAPAPLLQSQGGRGMPSPDSIASQVLKNVLPTNQTAPAGPAAPSVPQPDAIGMQAPNASYSDNKPLASSPFRIETPTAAPSVPTQMPTPNIAPGLNPAPALPNVPTTPNSLPIPAYPEAQPGPVSRDVQPNPNEFIVDLGTSSPGTVPGPEARYYPAPTNPTDPNFDAILQDIIESRRLWKNAPGSDVMF